MWSVPRISHPLCKERRRGFVTVRSREKLGLVILRVHIGSLFEEEPDHLCLSEFRGRTQGEILLFMNTGACLQQQLHDFELPGSRGFKERRMQCPVFVDLAVFHP